MGGCSGSKERPREKPWDSVNVGLDDELKGYTIPDDGEVPLTLYLSGATNVPKMDFVFTEGKDKHLGCDPYVKVRLQPTLASGLAQSIGIQASDEHQTWPIKNQNRHPMWCSARRLNKALKVEGGQVAPGQCTVRLELWDADPGVLEGEDDFIGSVEFDPASLDFNKPKGLALHDEEGKPVVEEGGNCCLHICLLPSSPVQKTVYFIRHGESTWNAAQDGMLQKGEILNVKDMATSRDNPLSEVGIAQAQALHTKVDAVANLISEGKEAQAPPGEVKFMSASTVWMSPLTRAVQTGLIGAASACAKIGKVRLVPNAREKRNVGGLDTSGQELGEGVMERVLQCTVEAGYKPKEAKALCEQEVDFSEVQYKWWNENAESSATVQARMEDFLAQVRFDPAESIIIVGHSHYFREIFMEFIHEDFAKQSPDLVKQLQELKLVNAGVARVELNFEQGEKMISEVELLFGTTLVK